MSMMRILAVVVVLLASPTSALADGVPVEPGLWEFSSSLPGPLAGDGGLQPYRACIRDRTITAERVMAEQKKCRIWNAVFAGASAKWKMRCETPAGPMTGSGSLRSKGTSVDGSLDFTMVLGSVEVPVTGDFRGRRVGACR